MSHREEQVSTRDLASTPPEDTARSTDQREEVGTESREGAVATADGKTWLRMLQLLWAGLWRC